MNEATYWNANDEAKGDGRGVSTEITRTLRARMSRMSSISAGSSNTSCRHSR